MRLFFLISSGDIVASESHVTPEGSFTANAFLKGFATRHGGVLGRSSQIIALFKQVL